MVKDAKKWFDENQVIGSSVFVALSWLRGCQVHTEAHRCDWAVFAGFPFEQQDSTRSKDVGLRSSFMK